MANKGVAKRVRDQQNAILKAQEKEAKHQTKMETWNEAAHSTNVTGRRRNHNKATAFNPDLYSKEDAANLLKYAKFSLKNRNISTPADISGRKEGEKSMFEKAGNNVDLNDRQDVMQNGTGGKTALADGYKHVYAKQKDDLDRKFRLLGKGGDFSEVRYHVPDEAILEFAVRGPATGRALKREADEQARLDALREDGETEAEKRKRQHEEAKVRRAAAAKKLKEDWRTNADQFTRTDIDFINEIQNMAISDKYLVKKQRKVAEEELAIRWEEHIGPKNDKIDYTEVDKYLNQEMRKAGANVRDQLKGRVVENAAWDVETTAFENNRYFLGVKDDQLKEYRLKKRNSVLDETMIKFAGTASDLVNKRAQLIKEGYTMPGESVDSFTRKLAGIDRRKNLWKLFTRFVVRRRAAFVKRMKDTWHGRKKRPMTKAEKELVMKESEALVDASDQGNRKLVKIALRFFADIDHRRMGRTSLQIVFKRQCWIDAGLEVEPTHQEGYNGKHIADYDGVIKMLLDNGADINALEGENTDGLGLVHHAARLGCYNRVKFFLDNGGKVDLRTRNGDTALMLACEGGHLDVIMLLIYTKHDIQAVSEAGMTMLHYASLTGNYHVLNFLLEAGADKNVEDVEGRTPLDICLERRYRVCAEKLQKFKIPKASMKDLVAFWRSIQDDNRPESRSLFGSRGGSRGSSRGGASWRDQRASRFLQKDKLRGTSFGAMGGKEHQKALRKKQKEKDRKIREKEKFDRENPKPDNALSYLEQLMAAAPKPKTPVDFFKKKKKKRKKKRGGEKEGEGEGDGSVVEEGEGGVVVVEKSEGEEELDSVLKEVEEETGVVIVGDEDNDEGDGIDDDVNGEGLEEAKPKKKISFFSPISFGTLGGGGSKSSKKKKENIDAIGTDGSPIRDSIRLELFGKIKETLSPFRRKTKKKERGKVEVGEVGKGDRGGGGGGGDFVVLPDISSPNPKLFNDEDGGGNGEMGVEGEEPKKKKRRKKKKKKKEIDGDASR
ncbi:hypothetical protein TrVE_jg5755 [Triparma verrucosa]|uniref:Uncharacterized protein n=1 Tax=Triparma verrucosa TaxID=1606542 RepID=A0A9W7BYC8_9STRA|nr:hypothetical protein TrVE_jg5755 [Triparma verrucosa]